MSDLPFLPLWVGKYMHRTAHLTLEEHGAYLRLLMLSWASPHCQIPADDKWVQRMLGVDDAAYGRVVAPILGEFFYRADGAWKNKKLQATYQANARASRQHSEAGKIGGQRSALKRREKRSSPADVSLDPETKRKATMPEPESISIKMASSSLVIRIRKAMGPGLEHRGRSIDDQTIARTASQWLTMGATDDEIVDVVKRQTETTRQDPLRHLQVLKPDIEGAIANRQPPPVDPHPEPLERPEGRAGDCLDAIIVAYGPVQAAAWLREAEWTEGAVVLPSEFGRDNAAKRFGGILGRFGFVAASRVDQKGASPSG